MKCALILTDTGHIKSYPIVEFEKFEVKDKHLFVGIIWDYSFLSPNQYPLYFNTLAVLNGFNFKPIEIFLMSISNTYIKPDLNEFRPANEVYDLFIKI
jgi:hypothetical protein